MDAQTEQFGHGGADYLELSLFVTTVGDKVSAPSDGTMTRPQWAAL
jgi:hypothetical protein